MAPAAPLPSRAHAVIIGGGVIGTSVAYHLTRLGITDVVLVEQGRLSSGTTWHAAGLVGQLRASEGMTRLVQYSTTLYADLEAETGLSAGYRQCGGVTVARTEDRMEQLRRTAANAAAFDLECELLSPAEALEHYPVMRTDDLVGAIWLPADGKANPTDLTYALAKGARMRGARIVEKTRVLDILSADGTVRGVRTDAGDIEAEIVVNCAGQWAKHLAAMVGANVPLHSAEHFYVVSEPIAGVHPDLPILRDPAVDTAAGRTVRPAAGRTPGRAVRPAAGTAAGWAVRPTAGTTAGWAVGTAAGPAARRRAPAAEVEALPAVEARPGVDGTGRGLEARPAAGDGRGLGHGRGRGLRRERDRLGDRLQGLGRRRVLRCGERRRPHAGQPALHQERPQQRVAVGRLAGVQLAQRRARRPPDPTTAAGSPGRPRPRPPAPARSGPPTVAGSASVRRVLQGRRGQAAPGQRDQSVRSGHCLPQRPAGGDAVPGQQPVGHPAGAGRRSGTRVDQRVHIPVEIPAPPPR